jgi:tetratricopeptide (TPR) repeat protein
VCSSDLIREIDKIIAAQLQADAHARELENAKTRLYNDAINRGEAYFAAKQYPDAISAYSEAQKIKPAEVVPPLKIKEIQSIIDALAAKALDDQKTAAESKLSSAEKSYLEKIKTADENFKNLQWSVARFYYIEALKFKVGDNYSLEKVDACDKMISSGITSEKLQEYKTKITKADDDMKAQNYSSAKFYYRSASDILRWESYPQKQLKEIDKIITEKLNASDQKLFTENLSLADDAFNRLEYTVARFYYNKASQIIQSDHVVSRLKEIDSITNGSEAKMTNAAYDDFIKKGDDALKQNNSPIARFYFQKASVLKPNENYPKEQLKKLDSETVKP